MKTFGFFKLHENVWFDKETDYSLQVLILPTSDNSIYAFCQIKIVKVWIINRLHN